MLIRTPQPSASPTALATPATAAAAPWRALFVQQLGQMPMPLCAVSTLHKTGDKTTPRVRNCVCRGLWASLPVNAKNPAPRNPTVYESDLPVFTTDARMAKAGEIGLNGGAVEAVWWASEAQTQWRVRGTAWLLGPDVETPTGAVARAAIQKHMRRTEGAVAPSVASTAASRTAAIAAATSSATTTATAHWSWSREVTAHFGNLSPGMRGSFRNPPPGQPRPPRGETGNTSPGEGLGDPVDNDHLDDPTARANFRVCVIVPEEVDQVDLSKGDDPRRWLYTYVGEDSEAPEGTEVVNGWAKQELWP